MAEGKLPTPTPILLFLLRHKALIFNWVHCHSEFKKKKKDASQPLSQLLWHVTTGYRPMGFKCTVA